MILVADRAGRLQLSLGNEPELAFDVCAAARI